MVIYISGEDTFRSRERLRQLRQAFIKKYDPAGMNVASFEGETLKFEEFQASVASQGFLSSRRFVVVERPFAADRKTQDTLAEFIRAKSVPEETIVVFWSDDATAKRGKRVSAESSVLAEVLKKTKHREVFEPLDPSEVEEWIVRRVRERGGQIEPAATEHLASIVGTDLWLAANELDKLLHRNQGKIVVRDVAESISSKEEANIFAFTDALSKKDERQALRLLENQFEQGANELYLLTMIARQVRILLSVGDLATSEPNPATISARLKLHPFVVKKALQQIRTFSQSELLRAHDELVEIDRKMKTSRESPRALLELFVLRLCSG